MDHFNEVNGKIQVQKAQEAKAKKMSLIAKVGITAVAATFTSCTTGNANWNSFAPTVQGYEQVVTTRNGQTTSTYRTYGRYDAYQQSRANYNNSRATTNLMNGVGKLLKDLDKLSR